MGGWMPAQPKPKSSIGKQTNKKQIEQLGGSCFLHQLMLLKL